MHEFMLRLPDHLGDGVMAIPAVAGIARLGPVELTGPKWAERLYAGIDMRTASNADPAILFKPSFSAAWTAKNFSRRVGLRGDWRSWLLTDPVVSPKAHRIDDYKALAHRVGASVNAPPSFETSQAEQRFSRTISAESVLLLPLSKSQATVGWTGFRDLADGLGDRALFAAGPGECQALRAIAGPHRTLPPLPIGEFAAVAQRVHRVVGNDSALAHLAAAARHSAGLPSTSVHVVFASTSPEQTGPIGCTVHRKVHLPCQPCYRKSCRIADVAPCLSVPTPSLTEAIQ